MKKKYLLVYNRNGLAELDWILPLLYQLRKDYKILFYFKSKECLNNIIQNKKIFFLWKKITEQYYVQKKYDFIFFRIIRKLILIFPKKNNGKLLKLIDSKIHNYKRIYKIFHKKNIKILFSEFDFNNPWIESAKRSNVKIIHYPSSPKIFPQVTRLNYKPRYNLKGDLLLLSSKYDLHYWKKLHNKPPVYISKFPKFDNNWIKKISVSKKIKKNSKETIFLYSYKYNLELYNDNQRVIIKKYVKNIISGILANKKNKIIFKLHPRTRLDNLKKLIDKFPKNQIKISNKHLYELLRISDFTLVEPLSSVFLDSLALKVPPIELFLNNELNIDKDLVLYSKLGLAIKTNNLKNFNSIVSKKKELILLGNKCVKNFFQTYKKNNNDSKMTYKFIKSIF